MRPKTKTIVTERERPRSRWSMGEEDLVDREELVVQMPRLDELGALPKLPYQFKELVQDMGRGRSMRAREARQLLVDMGEKSAPYLFEALEDPSGGVRAGAILALGEMGREDAINRAQELLHDKDHQVRVNAIRALGLLKAYTNQSVNELYDSLFYAIDGMYMERSDLVRAAAADALGSISSPEVDNALRLDIANEDDLEVRASSLQALRSMDTKAENGYKPLLRRGTQAVVLSEIQRSLDKQRDSMSESRERAVINWRKSHAKRSRELASTAREIKEDDAQAGGWAPRSRRTDTGRRAEQQLRERRRGNRERRETAVNRQRAAETGYADNRNRRQTASWARSEAEKKKTRRRSAYRRAPSRTRARWSR